MKFSTIFLVGFASAVETDNTAILTLNNLEKISSEILSSELINQRFSWKQRWTRKMKNNSDRMRKSFEKCGTKNVEANQEFDEKYDTGNPCTITKLMSGFSKWVDKYIASCNGQKTKSHQKNRLEKWKNIFNKGKWFNSKFITKFGCSNVGVGMLAKNFHQHAAPRAP